MGNYKTPRHPDCPETNARHFPHNIETYTHTAHGSVKISSRTEPQLHVRGIGKFAYAYAIYKYK